MPEDINKIVPQIMSHVETAKQFAIVNFRANLVLELSILTILIDAKVTTHEAAIRRIGEIREWSSDAFGGAEIDQRLDRAIELLRLHAKGEKPEFRL